MESRKMVPKNPFAGKEGRCTQRMDCVCRVMKARAGRLRQWHLRTHVLTCEIASRALPIEAPPGAL